MTRTSLQLCWLLLLCLIPLHAAAQTEDESVDGGEQNPPPLADIPRDHADCLEQAAATAPDDATAKELRAWCREYGELSEQDRAHNALRARLALEDRSQFNPFVLTPHDRNYVMPWSYWSNRTWNDPDRNDRELQPNEVKFQVSLKTPILHNFLGNNTLYGAFTMTSFWQAYNSENSRPFRETNYAPEIFMSRPVDWQLGPIDSELFSVGYLHESNGQSLPTSRGWDRVFLDYVFRTGQYYWSIQPWYRIPESEMDGPDDAKGDTNPDIEKYMGHFELRVARPFSNHMVELMVRNNLRRGENKGAGRIDYSFPINKRFKGIFQVFTGYGDSLINYNDYETRVSIGILLTDTL